MPKWNVPWLLTMWFKKSSTMASNWQFKVRSTDIPRKRPFLLSLVITRIQESWVSKGETTTLGITVINEVCFCIAKQVIPQAHGITLSLGLTTGWMKMELFLVKNPGFQHHIALLVMPLLRFWKSWEPREFGRLDKMLSWLELLLLNVGINFDGYSIMIKLASRYCIGVYCNSEFEMDPKIKTLKKNIHLLSYLRNT